MKLNWGILGTANIAERSIIPAIIATRNNQLKAIASRSQNSADTLADKFQVIGIEGYQRLLENKDINAVYIPLPTGMHYEWVKKALLAGKHVLVEKSAVENYEEATELITIAKQKKLALVENFQFQHHTQHQYVFELLEKDIIGDIRCFRSSFGFPPFSLENNIRYDKALGGGALLDSGAYTLKAVSVMMGGNFEVSDAFLSYHDKFKVDWYGGGSLINREKNILAQVAFGFDNFYQCNYEIWGSKGKITSHRAFTAKPNFNPPITIELNGEKREEQLPTDNHFHNMIQHFTKIIETKDFEEEYEKILRQSFLIDTFRQKANTSL